MDNLKFKIFELVANKDFYEIDEMIRKTEKVMEYMRKDTTTITTIIPSTSGTSGTIHWSDKSNSEISTGFFR